MTNRLVIIVGNSQVNNVDGDTASQPAGLPIAGCKIYRWHGDSAASTFRTVGAVESVNITNTTNFASHVPQCTFHCQLGKNLAAGAWGLAGDTISIATVGVNGSLIAAFKAGAALKYFQRAQACVLGAMRAFPAGASFKPYLGFISGENERDDAVFGPTIGADIAQIQSDFRSWLGVASLPIFGSLLYTGLGTQNATIRTQQTTAFTSGNGIGLFNTDAFNASQLDTLGTFGGVNVHWLTPGHNLVGAGFATILNAQP